MARSRHAAMRLSHRGSETQNSNTALPHRNATDRPAPTRLHRLLHLFVRLGEAAIFQVEITAVFDEALQFDSSPSISVLLPHRSESLVDGFAVFPHPLFLRPWLNHTCCEQRKDQGELLFALGLPTQDAPCLLRFAAPLPISMRIGGSDPRGDLFVGILRLPLAKVVQPLPQGHHGSVDPPCARHRAGTAPQLAPHRASGSDN